MPNGYLSITGRKKEHCECRRKTSRPAKVEAAVKAESPLDRIRVAIGDARRTLTR